MSRGGRGSCREVILVNGVLSIFKRQKTLKEGVGRVGHVGFSTHFALADLGGVSGARPPWDPILSFSHTFSPKSAHV